MDYACRHGGPTVAPNNLRLRQDLTGALIDPFQHKALRQLRFIRNSKVPNDNQGPVHIMMELMTKTTSDTYVEFMNIQAVVSAVEKHQMKLANGHFNFHRDCRIEVQQSCQLALWRTWTYYKNIATAAAISKATLSHFYHDALMLHRADKTREVSPMRLYEFPPAHACVHELEEMLTLKRWFDSQQLPERKGTRH